MHTKIGLNSTDVPVKVLNRNLACENAKFNVYFDHLIDELGSEIKNYLVVAPKFSKENLVTGAAILPIDEKGNIGLIRIFRPAIFSHSWEIPHGFIDDGECDKYSAIRELMEETGLVTEISNLSSMGYITPDAGVLAARVHLFVAKRCRLERKIVSELGLRGFQFFNKDEFERMIENSEVQDTFTLAAWCKYRLLEKK